MERKGNVPRRYKPTAGEILKNVALIPLSIGLGVLGVGFLGLGLLSGESLVVNLLQVPQPHIPILEALNFGQRNFGTDAGLAVLTYFSGNVGSYMAIKGAIATKNSFVDWIEEAIVLRSVDW